MPRARPEGHSRAGLILSGLIRAALLLGALCLLPFLIAKFFADIGGERR